LETNPFRVFSSWLFDGKKNSPIPKPKYNDEGKVITPDILKYNSPITHTYVISLFMRNGLLNHYLDKYLNNISLRYLTREELFRFIKQCVIDFKIRKNNLVFYRRRPRRLLYDALREKMPLLKNDDILLLCDLVEKSDGRVAIYDSLNLEKPKKLKLKKSKVEVNHTILEDFLEEHFSMIDV
jgi:hypothetical protein